jgi:hypothetical protein
MNFVVLVAASTIQTVHTKRLLPFGPFSRALTSYTMIRLHFACRRQGLTTGTLGSPIVGYQVRGVNRLVHDIASRLPPATIKWEHAAERS